MYRYAREKLFSAVEILATFPDDVRSRIKCAYMEFHPLNEDHFPDDLKEDWNWVHNSITKCGPKFNHAGEVVVGSVENTMSHIRKKTGTEIAARIFSIFYKLHFNEEYL